MIKPIQELVVISGKGGTGKTSVTAALAALARRTVIVDCDVDASNLPLVLEPVILERHSFLGGPKARVQHTDCVACGRCQKLCRFEAVLFNGPSNNRVAKTFRIDPVLCEGCGVCVRFCPRKAITLSPAQSGRWFVSQTRWGKMVHAELNPGAGNSGKLVQQLRRKSHELAAPKQNLILTDGAPGIGCPVIASLTGADLALVVAEPTRSSLHDLERVLTLCRHFGIAAVVAVNKWTLNETLAARIESQAEQWGAPSVGRIRHAPEVSEAQIHRQSVVEYAPESGVADDLRNLWNALRARLKMLKNKKHPLDPLTAKRHA